MWHSLAISFSWMPSSRIAAAISIAGAAAFTIWLFLDCSFAETARLAGQNLRLRFLRDAHLRFWNRWECYGRRLLLFALLALMSAGSALIAFIRLGVGNARERHLLDIAASFIVAAIWIALFAFRRRIWWWACWRRIAKLLPAMKAAAESLQQWPESSVFLPGLGNYALLESDPNRLLSSDGAPVPQFRERVGGIRRVPGECLRFGIESYRGLCVEHREDGWSPPVVSAAEDWSHRKTIHHRYDYALGGAWHLAFYTIELTFKSETCPEVLAEVAKRPLGLRLPHRGGRFRATSEVEVSAEALLALPGCESFPIGSHDCVLPKGEIVRLNYEPDPSRSTHCIVVPEDSAKLEDLLVEPEWRKDRDYSGYRLMISYVKLAADFEWLDDGRGVAGT